MNYCMDNINISSTTCNITLCENGKSTNRTLNGSRNSAEAIITQWAIAITAIFGLIGNFWSLIVLRTPQMKSAYSLLLSALTLSDSVQLVVYLTIFGGHLVGISKEDLDSHPRLSEAIYMQAFIALTASSYFTVLLAFERYIAVCNPFKALVFFPTKRRMFHYVLAIVLFSVIFNLPKWWERDNCLHPSAGTLRRTDSELKKNKIYLTLYVFLANVLVNFLVPLLIISVLNGRIYNGIREKNKMQRMLYNGQAQDISITFMLVIVVLVFCFCNMLYTIIRSIQYFYPSVYRLRITRIQNYLYTLNASINFIIYCLWGTKFREQLWILCHLKTNIAITRHETRSSIPLNNILHQ